MMARACLQFVMLTFLLVAFSHRGLALPDTLAPSDGESYDRFGDGVSLFENILAVGATGSDVAGKDSGVCYMYHLSADKLSWVFDEKVIPPEDIPYADFGASASLGRSNFGDQPMTLAIGAPTYENSGRAYIYVESIVNSVREWTYQSTLVSKDEDYLQRFGMTISLHGDTVAVASEMDDAPFDNSGSVYVFQRVDPALSPSAIWTQQAILTAIANEATLYFGRGVSLFGDVIVAGADVYDNSRGAAYVYHREDSQWTGISTLYASDGASGDQFGNEVAMDGSMLLVGAYMDRPGEDSYKCGAVYVFRSDDGKSWTEQAKLTADDCKTNDWYGGTIALSSNYFVVTSAQSDGNVPDAGSAHLYHRLPSGDVDYLGHIMAIEGAKYDYFGYSAAIYGDVCVIGAPARNLHGSDSGSVYTYNSTYAPTRSPTSAPSAQPSAIPTSVPSISHVPTLATEALIVFSVNQDLEGVSAAEMLSDNSYVVQFVEALSDSVALLNSRNIQVLSVTDTEMNEQSSLLSIQKSDVSIQQTFTTVSYNVSYLTYINGHSSPSDAYTALTEQILEASTDGKNSTLTQHLQALGGVYTDCSVSDVLPDISSYELRSLRSMSPTSSPSLSPSCGLGSYSNSSDGCLSCPEGTFSNAFESTGCSECSVGSYSDATGSASCKDCPWPTSTLEEGSTDCTAINIGLSEEYTMAFISCTLMIFMGSIMLSQDNKLTSFVIFTVPMLDFTTDLIYIMRSKYANLLLIAASVSCAVVLPYFCFLAMLAHRGAFPKIYFLELFRPLLWLSCDDLGYPTINGKQPRFFAFQFSRHDSIVKVFFIGLYWIVLILIQAVFSIPVVLLVLLHSPFLIFWSLIGAFIFQTKVISVGNLWNFWFGCWSASDAFHTELDLKVKLYNKSLLAEFLCESLPQFCIMWLNNTRTEVWSVAAYVSAFFSLFMTLDGIWRIAYYKIYSRQSFEDIPVGFGVVSVDNRNSIKKSGSMSSEFLRNSARSDEFLSSEEGTQHTFSVDRA